MAQWSKEHVVNSHIQYHISIFLQGLKETVHPYTFVSRNGFQEMLEVDGAYQKVLPILPKITFSIRAALVIKICLIYLRHNFCIFHLFDHISIGSLYDKLRTLHRVLECPVQKQSVTLQLEMVFFFYIKSDSERHLFIYLVLVPYPLVKKWKLYQYIKSTFVCMCTNLIIVFIFTSLIAKGLRSTLPLYMN